MLWADQWNNLIVSEEHQWSKRRWSIALFSRGIDPSLLSHLPFFSSLTSLINLDSSPRFGSMIAVLPRRYNIAVNRAADRITFESANCWTNCSVRTWLSSIWISRCIILNVTLITSIVFLWAIIISWTWLFVLCIHRNQVPRQGQSIDKNKQNKTIMRLLSWLTRGAVFRLWSKRLSSRRFHSKNIEGRNFILLAKWRPLDSQDRVAVELFRVLALSSGFESNQKTKPAKVLDFLTTSFYIGLWMG